jgi:hypothetical protein
VSRKTLGFVLAVAAAVFGIVAIVTRPFLFAPIGALCLFAAAKLTADRRVTAPAMAVLALGALAGCAIAVGFTRPLY